MKSTNYTKSVLKIAAFAGALATANVAQADDPSISGSLSFDFNTHFISYGADVWGAGNEFDDLLFNPSAGLNFDFGNGFGTYVGIWFDINDQADSTIGGDVQEIDVWIGGYYSWEDFTIDVAFQQWYYGAETEGIVDIAISYDTMFSPTLTIHNRIDGVGNQSNGTILDLGGSYDFEAGDLSLSIPVNVAFAVTDNYHGGEDGFAYFVTGISGSYPLGFIDEGLGSWDIHGGLSAWFTDDKVIPGNPDDFFITANFGVGVSW